MGAQDDRFLTLLEQRRPGKVHDIRAELPARYDRRSVRVARPRGSVAGILTYHHTVTPMRTGKDGALNSSWDYHIAGKGWSTGGYFAVVDAKGDIWICALPFSDMTYGAGERWNAITAHVVAVGDFTRDIAPKPMLQSLYSVGLSFDDASGVPGGRPWRPHGALKQTACPGTNLVDMVWAMTGPSYGSAVPRPEIFP